MFLMVWYSWQSWYTLYGQAGVGRGPLVQSHRPAVAREKCVIWDWLASAAKVGITPKTEKVTTNTCQMLQLSLWRQAFSHFSDSHYHARCGNETETSWYLPCKLQVIMCYRTKQFQSTVSLINRSNQRFTDICLDLYEWSHRAATYKPVREFTFFCCGRQQVLPDALPRYSKQFCVSNFMRTVYPSLSQYDCWCVPKKAGSWNFWVLSQSWNLEFPFDSDFPPGKSEKTQQPRVNNPRWRHWTAIKL